MSLASISDLHIIDIGDRGWKCLERFAAHPLVLGASHIGLLGDIFDLIAGDNPEWLERYAAFFDLLQRWCEGGKVVFYAEGNHDMHLKGLFRRAARDWSPAAQARLVLLKRDELHELGGVKVFLGHGDRYNPADTSYHRYMDFITRPVFLWAADQLVPYSWLKFVGEKASVKSRAYGTKKFDETKVKETFRAGVQSVAPASAQVVVGGHSHVMDEFHFGPRTYLNNGFPPLSGVFTYVDGASARLEKL